MRKNKKGSALLWALIVVGVLAVTIAAVLTITQSYYKRALATNNERQAYLTAKGVVEDLVDNISAGNEDYLSLFKDIQENEKTLLTVTLPSVGHLGTIDTSASYIERKPKGDTKGLITICIVANYADESYTVKADMQLGKVNKKDKWQLLRYYKTGDIEQVGGSNVANGSKLYNEMMGILNAYTQNGTVAGTSTIWQQKVLPILQNDPAWAEFSKSEKYADAYKTLLNRFDDGSLRKFYEFKGLQVLNTSEFKRTIINGVDLSQYHETPYKTENLLTNTYYIQFKFSYPDYDIGFIYACTTTGNEGKIHFFYQNGHWYFVDKVDEGYIKTGEDNGQLTIPGVTYFDGKDGAKGKEKWQRFSSRYLVDSNIVQ